MLKHLFKEFTFVSMLIILGSKLFKYIWKIYVLYSLHGKDVTMTSRRRLFSVLFTCFCFTKKRNNLKKGKRNGGQQKERKTSRSLFVLPISLPALRFLFTLSLTP